MRAIFIGNGTPTDRMFQVYDTPTVEALQSLVSLEKKSWSKEEILRDPAAFADVEYLFSTWGMPPMTKEEIQTCFPRLRGVFYGAGTVRAFAPPFMESGIPVFSAWAANAVPVAEYTFAQIMLANKGFFLACRNTKSPQSRGTAAAYARKMPGNYGTDVGLIGIGMVGRMTLERLRGAAVHVKAYDRFLPAEKIAELGAEKVSLEEIFSTCQVISNHVANLPETQGMFRYEHFSAMRPDAVFINTGRGAQVVEADLIRALKEEPNRTAVLDVTYPEPPEEGSELYTLPNVFLTPHLAGSSGREVARMGKYMLEEFRRHLSGEPCLYEVTEKIFKTMA